MIVHTSGSRVGARRYAYTLTEILVVVGIIAILAALGTLLFRSADRAVNNFDNAVAEAHRLVNKKARPVVASKPADHRLIPNQFIVVLKPGQNANAEAQRIATLVGGQVRQVYASGGFRGFSLNAPAETIPAIQAEPSVAAVEQDRIGVFYPQTSPTGISRMNCQWSTIKAGDGQMLTIAGYAPATASTRYRNLTGPAIPGANVTVAVIDSGIDFNHPDLYVPLNRGFSAANPDGMDTNGHGTHIAGIIGARDNDFGVVGVVPGCRLWALKVGNAAPVLSDTIAAVDFVTQNASQVQAANMSLGFSPVSPALDAAVNNCVAAGVVVVAPAGNAKALVANESPSNAAGALVVAAMADSDGKTGGLGAKTSAGNDDTFADFSNYGPRVNVIAPGVDILSTQPGNKYQVMSGSSMASAYVAGVAALIRDPNARPLRHRNLVSTTNSPEFTPARVLSVILGRSTEVIPGRFDARQYPMVNARDF